MMNSNCTVADRTLSSNSCGQLKSNKHRPREGLEYLRATKGSQKPELGAACIMIRWSRTTRPVTTGARYEEPSGGGVGRRKERGERKYGREDTRVIGSGGGGTLRGMLRVVRCAVC